MAGTNPHFLPSRRISLIVAAYAGGGALNLKPTGHPTVFSTRVGTYGSFIRPVKSARDRGAEPEGRSDPSIDDSGVVFLCRLISFLLVSMNSLDLPVAVWNASGPS